MAQYTIGSVAFAITVSSVEQVKMTPVRRAVVNRFDEHGDLLSLDRLPAESNVDFRLRMMDLSVHHGGPHYEGLLNNLARELGVPRQPALTISLAVDSAGAALASSPRVDILASEVVLYSDWKSAEDYTVDTTIGIYDPGDDGYFLNDLATQINLSTYFSATLDADVRPNLHSTNLVRGNSWGRITTDVIGADLATSLSFGNITQDSIWFSEKNIFQTEVVGTPQAEGEYSIDYTQGIVRNYSMPSGEGTCGYWYAQFPMQIDASLIHVYNLQDVNFLKKLFRQETLDSGSDVNALPNTEGAEIFHQLFKETQVMWGE
jgi:hypothetical protein